MIVINGKTSDSAWITINMGLGGESYKVGYCHQRQKELIFSKHVKGKQKNELAALREQFKTFLIDWGDHVTDDGKPLECNDENKDTFFDAFPSHVLMILAKAESFISFFPESDTIEKNFLGLSDTQPESEKINHKVVATVA